MVEVEINLDFFYLLEVERRPEAPGDKYSALIFISMSWSRMTDLQLGVVRDTLSKQKGRIKDPSYLRPAGVKLFPKVLRHTFSSANEYATKLCGLLTDRPAQSMLSTHSG